MRENKYFRTDFLEKITILAPLATDPLNTIIVFTSPEKRQDFVASLGTGLESLVQTLGLSVDSLVEYDIKMNLEELSVQASSVGQLPYRKLPFINAVSIELPRGVLDAISLKGEYLGIKERGMEEDSFVSASLDVTVPQVKVPPVWNKGFKGAGKKIAVLDTGIDTTHKDFQGRIGEKRVFTGEESVEDGHGHGTHVAGIAAGSGEYSNWKYTGVAPEAEILVAKVLTNSGRGRLSWVIAGIEWAVEKDAHVLNLSLGGAYPSDGTDALSLAVNKAVKEKDRVVCVAAGNFGPGEGTIGSPGAAKEAISVGSVDNQGKIADYSSRGPTSDGRAKPDLVAPGGASTTEAYVAGAWVASARSGDVEMGKPVTDSLKYREARGTSMATPHVAGICALILQSGLAPNQVKERLKSTADRLESYDENTQGAGLVNAEKALKQAVSEGDVQIKFVRSEMEWRDSMGSHDIRRMRIYLKNEGTVAADDVIPYLIPQIDKQIHVLQPHGEYGTLTPGEEDQDSFLLETKGTPAGDYNLTLNVSYVKSGGEKETKSLDIPLTVQSEAASSSEPLLSTLYESHTELQGKTEVAEFTQQHGLASWGEDRITDQERLVHLVSEDLQKFLLIRVDLTNQVQGIQSSEGLNVHIGQGEAINKAKQEIGKATVEFKETNVFPTTTEESSIDERRPYWKVRLKIEEEGLHKVFTVCVSATDGKILGRTLLVNSK